MAQLTPYLRFNGNAREAFEFYKSCLGGEVTYTTVAESPMAATMPDKKDKIFHAQLKNGALMLLGGDMADAEPVQGNKTVITVSCDTKDEAAIVFAKLSAGGKIGHELMDQPWGTIGDFVDKYGVEWFVVSTAPMPKM